MKKVIVIAFLFVTLQSALYAQQTKLSEEGYKNWIKAQDRMKNIKQESDYTLLLNIFLKVIETDSLYAPAYFNMGIVYTKIGEFSKDNQESLNNYNKAKECYEKHLVLNPSEKTKTIQALAKLEIKIDDLMVEINRQREQEQQQELQRQLQLEQERMLTTKGSRVFNSNGVKLNKGKVSQMMTNTNALQMYNKGISRNRGGDALITLGTLAFTAGLTLIILDNELSVDYAFYNEYGNRTYYLERELGKGGYISSWVLMGAGVAMLVPGITLKINGKKHIKNSVVMHNDLQKTVSAEFKCNFTSNGLSLTFNF